MSSNKNEEVLDRACINFNRQLKKLMSIICSNGKRDLELEDMRKKVILALDVDDRIAIKIVGPYINEYKQYIDNNDFDTMLKDEVINLKKYNADDAANMRIFNVLKQQYVNFNQDERDVIHDIIKNSLKYYIMFSS